MRRFLLNVLCVLTVAFNSASAQNCNVHAVLDSLDILFNGPVTKLASLDNILYAGGAFTSVGKFCGNTIEIDRKTGAAVNRRTWPKVRGSAANFSITDGSGNLFIFGSFTKAGDSLRNGFAMIDASGHVNPLKISVNGTVNAAVVYNGVLYLGGYFTKVNNILRNYLAAIDLSTGTVTNWAPDITTVDKLPARVECLWASGGLLYIGGAFSHVGGVARKNIAALDIATGAPTSWDPQAYYSTAPDYGTVFKMLLVNNLLFIAGEFDYAGGSIRPAVAAIDRTTGIATSWAPNPNVNVFALANKGDTLYLGGMFYKIGGQTRQGFAAYSISSGNLLPITINTGEIIVEQVHTIVTINDTIYVGGRFDSIAGAERQNLAAFNRLTGAVLPWESNTSGVVNSLLAINNRLYASGNFFSVGMKARSALAAIDMDADTVLSWHPKLDDAVNNFTLHGKKMYLSGQFSMVNDSLRPHTAMMDVRTLKVSKWNPQVHFDIVDMAFYKNDIYICGNFDSVEGQSCQGIAKLDTNGSLQPWSGSIGGAYPEATSMGIYKDTLYLTGTFTNICGQSRNVMGAINLVTGQATSWQDGTLLNAWKLKILDTTLYAAITIPNAIPTPPNLPKGLIVAYDVRSRKRTSLDSNFQNNSVTDIFLAPDKSGVFAGPGVGLRIWNAGGGKASISSPKIGEFITAVRYGNKIYGGGAFVNDTGGVVNAMMVVVPQVPMSATISADTNIFCYETQATTKVSSTVTYGVNYQWRVNGMNVPGFGSVYTYKPHDGDSVSCIVSSPLGGCVVPPVDTTNDFVYQVLPTIIPDIYIAGPAEEEAGKQVTIKALVQYADTGYTIEWFNKGTSMGKTTVDSITYTKGSGTDSIYAIITPRTDTCYVTDTSALITINEKPEGISDANGDAGIGVYPNPFDKFVKITGLKDGDVLMLYDITGRKILMDEYQAATKEYIIASGYLKAGTYVLKITDRHGASRKNVLIQKQ